MRLLRLVKNSPSFRLEDVILSEILFSFCLLVTKCGVFLKMTNFSVDQSGAFVMGGVAYGIRAHFKQVLSLILILACIFVLFIS